MHTLLEEDVSPIPVHTCGHNAQPCLTSSCLTAGQTFPDLFQAWQAQAAMRGMTYKLCSHIRVTARKIYLCQKLQLAHLKRHWLKAYSPHGLLNGPPQSLADGCYRVLGRGNLLVHRYKFVSAVVPVCAGQMYAILEGCYHAQWCCCHYALLT